MISSCRCHAFTCFVRNVELVFYWRRSSNTMKLRYHLIYHLKQLRLRSMRTDGRDDIETEVSEIGPTLTSIRPKRSVDRRQDDPHSGTPYDIA